MSENIKNNLENTIHEERQSIIASTKTKLIMKLEDPTDTYSLFGEEGKKSINQHVSGVDNPVIESCNANFEKDRQMKDEIASKFTPTNPDSIASCNVKVYMKLDNLQETYELFEKSVSEENKNK